MGMYFVVLFKASVVVINCAKFTIFYNRLSFVGECGDDKRYIGVLPLHAKLSTCILFDLIE